MPTRLFSRALLVAGLALLVGAAADRAAAQTVWSRPYENNQIAAEVVVPAFENDAIAWQSGAAYLTATYSLNENVELVGELPAARIDSGGVAESTLGNPYFGVGLTGTRLPFLVEIGVRIPVVRSNSPAAFAGSFTDVARTRAFRADETLVAGLLNWRFEFDRKTSFRVRAGGVYAEFPNVVDGSRRIEQDLRAKYNAQLWYEGNNSIVGLTFAGQATLTAPGYYGGKSLHWIGGSLIGNFDHVRPGVFVGLSFDRIVRDDAPLFIGITVSTSYDN